MQTITLQAEKNVINKILDFAKDNELKITINQNDNLPTLSDDEIYKEVLKRSKEIHNGTAELLSLDEFKKDMDEFLKTLWLF